MILDQATVQYILAVHKPHHRQGRVHEGVTGITVGASLKNALLGISCMYSFRTHNQETYAVTWPYKTPTTGNEAGSIREGLVSQ